MEDWLHAAARRRPDHPALVASEASVTYAELDAAASATARALAGEGARPGTRVALALPPGRDFAELLHALPRLGAAVAPLDPRLPAGSGALRELRRGQEKDVELCLEHEPGEVHSVIHTSGTTGEPRPVELTFGNHLASATASAELLGAEEDDRWLCVLPLHHVGGLAILLRSAIYATTAVVHDRFEAGPTQRALENEGITIVSLVRPCCTGSWSTACAGPRASVPCWSAADRCRPACSTRLEKPACP